MASLKPFFSHFWNIFKVVSLSQLSVHSFAYVWIYPKDCCCMSLKVVVGCQIGNHFITDSLSKLLSKDNSDSE